MHTDDATAFLVDYIRQPRPSDGYPSFGYEMYLPNVIAAYMVEVERATDHHSAIRNSTRARELSPFFYDAAWNLCRRGILRPSVRVIGLQSAGEGDGYKVTALGRDWVGAESGAVVVLEPTRLGRVFSVLSRRLGSGFLQRANEAARCHAFGLNLGCCAMSGAAAESVLLAIAIAKSGNEAVVLRTYQGAQGRRKIVDSIVGKSKPSIGGPLTSAAGLLSYWRDEAAHGLESNISEIEAHEALSRLLRFAQFANDNWVELTAKS